MIQEQRETCGQVRPRSWPGGGREGPAFGRAIGGRGVAGPNRPGAAHQPQPEAQGAFGLGSDQGRRHHLRGGSRDGERCGLFFGDPAMESPPVDPNRPWTWLAVAEFAVDLETDDLDSLAAMVELLKGSCTLRGEHPEDPQGTRDGGGRQDAEIIYAVDAATGDRCGVIYGDPAGEMIPAYGFDNWRKPCVLEVRVNPLSDDREVLAEAILYLQGFVLLPDGRGGPGEMTLGPILIAPDVRLFGGGRPVNPGTAKPADRVPPAEGSGRDGLSYRSVWMQRICEPCRWAAVPARDGRPRKFPGARRLLRWHEISGRRAGRLGPSHPAGHDLAWPRPLGLGRPESHRQLKAVADPSVESTERRSRDPAYARPATGGE